MNWAVAYMAALWVTLALCWGRGPGFRRAALILGANWLAQVGCQLVVGLTPAWYWMWLDLVTALAIAFCPYAGRAHAVVATALGAQVLLHIAFWAAGHAAWEQAEYLALIGFLGWGQLATLLGGAWHGPFRRNWMDWAAGRRLAPAVDRHRSGVEAGR